MTKPFDIPVLTTLSLLFVEDDAMARETASFSLKLNFPRLRIYTAGNGRDGLELYRKYHPDIVLTDIKMPAMDGMEMSQEILAMEPGANIIVTSGHSDLTYLLQGIKMGIRRYVLKPLDHELLFEAVSDCMSRVLMQRQMQQQEQYIGLLSQAVEQSPSLILIADPDGRIEYANGKFLALTGYTEEEVLRMDLRQFHLQDPDAATFEQVWSQVNAGAEWHGEGVNRKKDGQLYRESVTISPITEGEGRIAHFVTVREDVTLKKRAEEEMILSQKLKSLGVLAGGLAHDFNNIMTGVLGNISFAQTSLSDPAKVATCLAQAEKASLRAVELTRQLLTFARGGKPVKKQVEVRHLIEESVALGLRGSKVQGVVRVPAAIAQVEVDSGQIIQAFNNILINAVQAMPDGGTVAIEAEGVRLEQGNSLGLSAGSYVRVSFTDQGSGVPDEVKGKIFDPYFSTKTGNSGLGLTTAHSIVSRHGGHIGVQSSPGGGATFICHLPAVQAPHGQAEAPQKAPLAPHPGAGQSILLMDDDQDVRTIGCTMLESLGFQVATCSCGEEAIDLYIEANRSGKRFSAVIMDLTVPGGMGGKEAAERILAFDPQACLVVSSGYSDDPVMADYQQYGFCSVLPKPYVMSSLAELMSTLHGGVPGS
ncbi:hypothetical protein GMSM_01800 [Geomonas sp. Red276]